MLYVTYPILLRIELFAAMHSETAWRILKEMNRQDGWIGCDISAESFTQLPHP